MTVSNSGGLRAENVGSNDADETPRRRSLKSVASELWHQKPGARAARPVAPLAPGAKEIVNGLEKREVIIGAVLSGIDVSLAVVSYFYLHNSHILKDRQAAATYLIAGLIAAAIMIGGVVFRRRALLGFGAFFVGMELLTTGLLPEALVFLFFGGWLIFRVMKKQRQDQAAGKFSGTIDTGGRRSRSKQPPATPVPQPSKRYTPPRRRAPARRR